MSWESSGALSWLPYFKLPNHSSYDEYRVNNVSYLTLGIFIAIGILLQLSSALRKMPEENYRLALFIRVLAIVCQFPGLYTAYRIKRLQVDRVGSFQAIAILGSISILITTCTHSFIVFIRTYNGQCPEDEPNYTACNPDELNHSIPQDAAMPLLLVLIAAQMLMKCYHRWVLLLCWTIATTSVMASIIIIEAHKSTFIPLLALLAGFLLYNYESSMYNSFVLLQNLEATIRSRMHAENEKRVTEMQAVEMRHLLGNVAHDLKTPMQSFVLDLEFVHNIMKHPISQTSEIISYTHSDVARMLETVQHLIDTNSFMYMVINRAIDYAKSSEDHKLVPNLETINVAASIEWAINVVRSKCVVPVMMEPLSPMIYPHIITDKQWLIENILCLISNAAKFTTSGYVTVRCEMCFSCDASLTDGSQSDISGATGGANCEQLLIEVEDTGIGIPEEKRESMFQPFQQTMRMAGGTGLGLYSMRKRVEALKGTCGILSRRDGTSGARIWFKIPYRPDKQDCDGSELKDEITTNGIELNLISQTVTNISTHSGLPRMLILLVDDAPNIRQSISRVLVNEGCTVHLAENGQMALEMMGLKRYDLVLMDLQMPVMDGLEAMRRLRKHESECGDEYHQVVIGISAYTGEPYCSDAVSAGMDGFMEKPFSLKKFFDMCGEYVPKSLASTQLETNHDSIAHDFSKVAILIADDSHMIRKSISRVLSNEGLSVDLAENGQVALEMMGLKRYDLVLMDLQMPVMDGLEAVRRLRKYESECGDEYHQVVIGISGYNGEPHISDATSAGMDGFMEKPFTAQRFFDICSKYLGSK